MSFAALRSGVRKGVDNRTVGDAGHDEPSLAALA
jgi:hypothetical protein